MSIKNIPVGGTVNFSIYGNIEGRVEFSGTVIGHVTSAMAAIDPSSGIVINHANIWPTLPEDVKGAYANSPNSYEYTVVQAEDGTSSYIGDIWVNNDTIVTVNRRVANIELSDFDDPDTSNLSQLLQTHGYKITRFTISTPT